MTTTRAAAFVRRHRTGLSVIGLSLVLLPVPLILVFWVTDLTSDVNKFES